MSSPAPANKRSRTEDINAQSVAPLPFPVIQSDKSNTLSLFVHYFEPKLTAALANRKQTQRQIPKIGKRIELLKQKLENSDIPKTLVIPRALNLPPGTDEDLIKAAESIYAQAEKELLKLSLHSQHTHLERVQAAYTNASQDFEVSIQQDLLQVDLSDDLKTTILLSLLKKFREAIELEEARNKLANMELNKKRAAVTDARSSMDAEVEHLLTTQQSALISQIVVDTLDRRLDKVEKRITDSIVKALNLKSPHNRGGRKPSSADKGKQNNKNKPRNSEKKDSNSSDNNSKKQSSKKKQPPSNKRGKSQKPNASGNRRQRNNKQPASSDE
jgi:hypothetical protein